MSRKLLTKSIVLVLILLILAGGMSGAAAAVEESDCGVDGCLDDPDNDQPEVVPGGGVAFDTPVVESKGVMPGDRVTLGEDFKAFLKAKKAFNQGQQIDEDSEAFLKAKKAFHEGRQPIEAIEKGDQEPEDVPTFFDDDE